MNRLVKWAWIAWCATTAISTAAQQLTTLATFIYRDGTYPEAAMTQGSDGNLYGTLTSSRPYGGGTIFKINPTTGELTVLHRFCTKPNCPDGAEPYAGLVEASDGNFYGTTFAGGSGHCNNGVIPGCGTVFRMTPQGKLTTLYSICTLQDCLDGAQPIGALVQAEDGKFYGTTSSGGEHNRGTVFVITAQGMLKTLHSFNGPDGDSPAARDALVQSTDRNFYGTTAAGGTYNGGTVFRITSRGKLTTLYSFCAFGPYCADGLDPITGLIQASNGSFYGVTGDGGLHRGGTIFKISRSGKFNTVHSFCEVTPNCQDGSLPRGRLTQAIDGYLYGTTTNGGANGGGTIFRITPGGRLTTLHSFCGLCGEGTFPWSGLVQASDGLFYGTTAVGGTSYSVGTVFTFSARSGD